MSSGWKSESRSCGCHSASGAAGEFDDSVDDGNHASPHIHMHVLYDLYKVMQDVYHQQRQTLRLNKPSGASEDGAGLKGGANGPERDSWNTVGYGLWPKTPWYSFGPSGAKSWASG